jgi:Cu/Ag efflux pump CusA
MRVEELISGVRATLALKIYGEDLDKLEELSAKIKTVLGGVPGVADLSPRPTRASRRWSSRSTARPRRATA